MGNKTKTVYPTLTLDGEALYLKPWESTKGSKYGHEDRDMYEVTLVNLDEASMALAIENGRYPTTAKRGTSKFNAGFKEYYKFSSLFPIPYVDAQVKDMPEHTHVGNGSKIRVYLEVRPIAEENQQGNTHKFICTGVQLLKLVEMPDDPDWEPGQKNSHMGTVDGGYEAVSEPTSSETAGFEKVVPEEDPLDDEIPF